VKVVENSRVLAWLTLGASLLIALGVWRWTRAVLVPSNTLQAQSKGIPIGNNSDLYPRWLGARELLLHGRDPYSAEITRESQIGYYGRPLDPDRANEPTDMAAFAYPVPVVFLLAPTIKLPFATVQVIFRWVLLLSIAASVPLWLRAVGFELRWEYVVSAALLAVSSSPGISSYYKQNLSPLIILFIAGAAAAAVRRWLALSGLLLALATVKPQITGLFIVFFLLWAAARWSERQSLVWGFLAASVGLLAAAEAVLPHWIREFFLAARSYEGYSGETSILRVLLPTFLAHLISALLVVAFLVLCWSWRHAAAGSEPFAWGLAWAGASTLVVLPKLSSYNQPLLIPSLLVLIRYRQEIWKAGLLARAFTKGAFTCQLWQWGTASILALLSLLLSPAQVRRAAGLPEYTLFALAPLTLLAVVAATFPIKESSPGSAVKAPSPAGRHG
jgi:hypothetical protein